MGTCPQIISCGLNLWEVAVENMIRVGHHALHGSDEHRSGHSASDQLRGPGY